MILSRSRRFFHCRRIPIGYPSSIRADVRIKNQRVEAAPLAIHYCSCGSNIVFGKRSITTSSSTMESEKNGIDSQEGGKDTLKETIRRMQQEGNTSARGSRNGDDDTTIDPRIDDFVSRASNLWFDATEEVGKTWDELVRSGERKDINKKINHPSDTAEGETEYTGPVSIMVIDESENLTAWERMQKRLTDAPVIQGKYQNYCALIHFPPYWYDCFTTILIPHLLFNNVIFISLLYYDRHSFEIRPIVRTNGSEGGETKS